MNCRRNYPRFLLRCTTDGPAGELAVGVDTGGLHPAPRVFSGEKREIYVLGSPIVGGRIDHAAAADLFRSTWSRANLRSLDGEFLIIGWDREERRLFAVNDRFASIPLFYLQQEATLILSVSYVDLWRECGLAAAIEPYPFFEFIRLQRLMADHTFDVKSKFLPSASQLTFDGRGLSVGKYWHCSFRKRGDSLGCLARELASVVRQSLRMKTSDDARFGLFLSGGVDSRLLLAAFEDQPVCFTLAVSENNECRVARRVAEMKGCRHVYLPIPPDKYSAILEPATRLGGGMFVYDHALFLDYDKPVSDLIDVAFHGHGLDYMFQGMYVPLRYRTLRGKNTYFPVLEPFDRGNVVEEYINRIPYRLKGVDLLDYVLPPLRQKLDAEMRGRLGALIEDNEVEFTSAYDQYEYLINHSLSRHYSNTNISSISTYVEQRTAIFQNDLFHLYLGMPIEYRLGARVARRALHLLDRRLARVITANTKMRAISGPLERTAIQVVDSLLRKSHLIGRSLIYPKAEERTWPGRDKAIRRQPVLRAAVEQAVVSERLAALGFLDMDKLARDVGRWLERDQGGGALMATLITVDRFLKL